MMNNKMICLLFICLSPVFLSCSGGNESFVQPVTGWVIGLSENEVTGESTVKILKTSNGGTTWELQTLPANYEGFNGNDISAVNDGVAWAAMGATSSASSEGGILHTADGGSTWTLQTLPDGMTNRHIKGIKGVSPAEAWAVSIGGDVLHTTDAGATWQIVPVRTATGEIIVMTQVNRMDVNGQDIWIVDVAAAAQGVIHSPDGGLTWRQEQLPDIWPGHGPLAISAFSSLTAWVAVNSEGNLWWTSNGGHSWNKSNDSLTGTADYDDICATSADVVWIACNGGGRNGGFTSRVRVTDGNFSANTTDHYPYMMEGVSPVTDDKAWAVGFRMSSIEPALPRGAIFFTRNGGVNWEHQALPSDAWDVVPWKISFVGARR